jgi:hypothetical protein
MFLIIAMLSPTSSEKVKDAHSSLVHAAPVALNLMNSAQEAAKVVLHMVEEVDTAAVILSLIIADIIDPLKIMIVRMMMLTTMPHYPVCKCSEEEQEASVSLVLLVLEVAAARILSVSSTLVLEVGHPPKLKSKLEAIK